MTGIRDAEMTVFHQTVQSAHWTYTATECSVTDQAGMPDEILPPSCSNLSTQQSHGTDAESSVVPSALYLTLNGRFMPVTAKGRHS